MAAQHSGEYKEYLCRLFHSPCFGGHIRCTDTHLHFESGIIQEKLYNAKSGFLHIKANQAKQSSRHWFTLKDNKISWYQSRMEPYFPIGVLDLRHVALHEYNRDDPCFSLQTNREALEFTAMTTRDKKEWMEAIHTAILWSKKIDNRVTISIPHSDILKVQPSTGITREVSGVQVVTGNQDGYTSTYSFDQFSDPLAALGDISPLVEKYHRTHNVADQATLAAQEGPAQTNTNAEDAFLKFQALLFLLPLFRLLESLLFAGTNRKRPEIPPQGSSTDSGFQPTAASSNDSVVEDSDADDFYVDFAYDQSEVVLGRFFGYIYRSWPVYGQFSISSSYMCFKSSSRLNRHMKMVLPLCDILSLEKMMPTLLRYWPLVVNVSGHEEIFLQFSTEAEREAVATLLEHQMQSILEMREEEVIVAAFKGNKEIESAITESKPHSFDSNKALHFTFLTIGSRGDVQPYIALAKGLMLEGHRCRVATHGEFKEWIESHGLEFGFVSGDPAEMMRMCTENDVFTLGFLKELFVENKWDGFTQNILQTTWEACQGTDVLVECPNAMAGYHIAEALGVPYFRMHLMPWSKTRAYPHGFGVPTRKRGGTYNYMSHIFFDQIFWRLTAGMINKWRREVLHLPPTSLGEMELEKIPFLYNFSPIVVPPPLDWPEWINITGYWLLNDADVSAKKWTPPDSLIAFIEKARNSGKKIVYIGFGSVVVRDPQAITHCVIEAVVKSGVYAILSKGWSDRLHMKTKAALEPEEPLPPQIYPIASIPHDWLFSRIDAACHHGGAGTTGASLRAGIPTVIHPFFGDQYFWASRVQSLGVGTGVSKLTVPALTDALVQATTDSKQIRRAKALGERLQKEDGVATAIHTIHNNMDYARSQIKRVWVE